jgi:UDP-N-acetylmuramate-alanine ligase
MDAGVNAVAAMASAGDAVITLGAGSVSQASGLILEKLRIAA